MKYPPHNAIMERLSIYVQREVKERRRLPEEPEKFKKIKQNLKNLECLKQFKPNVILIMEGGVVNICSKGGKRTVENQRWPQGPERNDSYCPSDFIPSYFSFFFKLSQIIISFWYATPAFENIVRRGERGCPNAHPHIQSKPHFDKKVKFKGKTIFKFQNFSESPGFQKKL